MTPDWLVTTGANPSFTARTIFVVTCSFLKVKLLFNKFSANIQYNNPLHEHMLGVHWHLLSSLQRSAQQFLFFIYKVLEAIKNSWEMCFVLLLHTWLSQLLLIIYRGMITLVLTLKAKKKGKSPVLIEVLTILWCKLQFVYGNYKQLKSGSKSTAWWCFLHFTNRPRLSINASICYVSTVPFWSYAWSFMNDAESCRTRKNNDMVRQEV